MQKYNLNELIQFDDKKPSPKVLANERGRRIVLLCLRAGQSIPEHANQEQVIVHVVQGHITFYEAGTPHDLHAGEVICLESGAPHRLEAHEDSVMLVLAVGSTAVAQSAKELDLRALPHSQRHALVFATLDALKVSESFILINDHDPIPLHMQIDDVRPGEATWEYERREPGLFRIRIKRIAPAQATAISA